jgi:predicted hydrolase (HD superfamily)
LTGLLHDLDYDQTAKDFPRHGLVTAEMLAGKVDDKIIYAIKAHPGHVPAVSRLDQALYAVDPVTGLIVASALMSPEKKLSGIDRDFVLRRYKEKKFAAGANREQIASCSTLGLTLEDFVQMCVEAMKGIATDLGL